MLGIVRYGALLSLGLLPCKGVGGNSVHDFQGGIASPPVPVLGGIFLGALFATLLMGLLFWRHQQRAFGLSVWGKRQTQPLLRAILAQANLLMWSARVKRFNGRLNWEIEVMPQSKASPLMRLVRDYGNGSFWRYSDLPDYEVMMQRCQEAVLSDKHGYQQEFPVRDGEKIVWMSEEVGIQRIAPDEWFLFGVMSDVTARHEAEEKGRSNANQVRTMLERADCLLWRCTVTLMPNGKLDWFFDIPNSGLQKKIFGLNEGYRTKTIYKGFQVTQLAQMNDLGTRAILSGEPGYEQRFKLTRISDGQSFWLHEQVTITPDGPGRWQLTGVALDMTERHHAEEARKQTEEQLQQILMRVDCLLWHGSVELDAHGEYHWNIITPPSILGTTLLGEGPPGVRPMDWTGCRIPQMAEMTHRAKKAIQEESSGYKQEFQLLQGDKTYWLHEQVAIRVEGPGRYRVFGVVTDITAMRVAEQALAAEKERLAVTLRAMEEAVITLDSEGRVQFMNQAAGKLRKTELENAIGCSYADALAFVNSESGETVNWSIEATLKEGLVVEVPGQMGLRGNQEKICAVEGCCVPLRNPASEVIGAVLVLRDVTERQRLETKLQRASKLEAVGILAGGIAHDFNNILTAILGNLSLASLDARGRKPLELYLNEAQNASVRARDLTQQLLTFARGGDPVRSAVHVADIVEEVARFALRGSKVKCELSIPMDLWFADADKGQLSQIVQNIVINAAQAMPEGGAVTISAFNETVGEASNLPLAPGDYIHLSLKDTGTGMPQEILAKIFDPYFTTKKTGSGLGLATVYSIVKKHRGFIDVESELGHGTTFHIRLPALRARKQTPARAPAITPRKVKGRILAMDDEASIRRLVSRLLTRMGLEVDLASSGEEAVEKYRAAWEQGNPHDLLLMDLTVPGAMGGCDALTAIRKLNPQVKAIVASGYSSDPIMANFKDFGFCAMVAKPYAAELFSKTIQEAIETPVSQT